MKKYVATLLTLMILMISLTSCRNGEKPQLPDGAVPVLSNYPNLSYILPGAYDLSKYEDGIWARNGYSTYVASVNGNLAVMPNHIYKSSSAPYIAQDIAYAFENVKGDDDGVYLDGELVIDEPCVGMIHSYYRDTLLVFTTADGNSTVHVFDRKNIETSLLLSEQTILIEGKIRLVYYDWKNMHYDAPNEIYVITSENVVILKAERLLNSAEKSLATVEVITLQTPDWWQYVSPTNATQTKDGTVFVGEREGVIGIEPDGTMKYYPIDYSTAIYGDM